PWNEWYVLHFIAIGKIMNTQKKTRPIAARPSWARFWPHLVWIILVGSLAYLVQLQSFEARSRERLLDASAISNSHISENIYNSARILFRLRKDPTIQRAVSRNGGPFRAQFSSRMEEFARNYPEIIKIRWMDESGMERIRINQYDGNIQVLSPGMLQDKSGRYFFWDALKTPFDSLYVSPLDLNVEHGKVQVPHRPVLRIGVRVKDHENLDAGVLLINVDARPILERLQKFRERADLELHFINPQGFWMLGTDESKSWGEDLNRPEMSFAREHPEVWTSMQSKPTGELLAGDGLWLYSAYNPDMILLTDVRSLEVPRWRIAIRIPAVIVAGLHWPSLWRSLLGMAFLAIAVLFIDHGQLRLRRLRRQAEARERTTHDELLKSERLSSLGRIVSGLAHEINTPLGAARLTSTTIRDHCKELSLEVRNPTDMPQNIAFILEGNSMIVDCLDQASRLIQTFKQLSADRETVQVREFDLEELIENLLQILHPRIRHSGHRVQVSIPEKIRITSYPGPLGQILQNLIANALDHAFTIPGGTIQVEGIRRKGQIQITVQDNGVGIPSELLDQVFEPFLTTMRGQGGTGLGLSISKELVEGILGGDLSVESQSDRGSRFTVQFPERIRNISQPM
ncbi:MAG: sensor histidine kinase, partial [Leptospiraceae bacterium]|nr:sensor histidine kinase [Leptospiraceae bacterium]